MKKMICVTSDQSVIDGTVDYPVSVFDGTFLSLFTDSVNGWVHCLVNDNNKTFIVHRVFGNESKVKILIRPIDGGRLKTITGKPDELLIYQNSTLKIAEAVNLFNLMPKIDKLMGNEGVHSLVSMTAIVTSRINRLVDEYNGNEAEQNFPYNGERNKKFDIAQYQKFVDLNGQIIDFVRLVSSRTSNKVSTKLTTEYDKLVVAYKEACALKLVRSNAVKPKKEKSELELRVARLAKKFGG